MLWSVELEATWVCEAEAVGKASADEAVTEWEDPVCDTDDADADAPLAE